MQLHPDRGIAKGKSCGDSFWPTKSYFLGRIAEMNGMEYMSDYAVCDNFAQLFPRKEDYYRLCKPEAQKKQEKQPLIASRRLDVQASRSTL
jgi:hypothetical protein